MLRFLLIFLLLVAPAQAHFSPGTQIREIVLSEEDGAPQLWVRAPLPLIFAAEIAQATEQQTPLDTPMLYPEDTGRGLRYRVDQEAFLTGAKGHLARALRLTRNGQALPVEITALRLRARRPDAPMDSATAARAAMEAPSTRLDPVFGEAVVDYALRLPAGSGAIKVSSALPEIALPEGVRIDNHLTRDLGRPMTLTRSGQLTTPASFPRSAGEALISFVRHGFQHIATGWDHVFLVICFALGIGWSRQLFWVVTAFTLGHSVTLTFGALSLVPQAPWFIPAIEMAIAASVVLAAFAAWRNTGSRGATLPVALLACGVGLIHGFGFASFLSESLSPEMPGFVPALAGFNIGLELGQIALVMATLAIFAALGRVSRPATRLARFATLAGLALIAGSWTIERFGALIS